MTNDDIDHMLTKIQEEGRGLNKWEEGFIESIKEQFESNGSLSEKQTEILERIYAAKTP